MAVSTRSFHRPRDYSRLFIGLAVLAGMVAVAPIAAAILGLGGTGVTTRTAFAAAPAGEYAVIGRSEGTNDIIAVAWTDNPGAVTEIARIPHLEGFTSTGAVSPDGKSVAMVTVDGGSRTQPLATLNVVNLETGRIVRAAENVLPGQSPVWSTNSSEVVAVRIPGGNTSAGKIEVLTVGAGGDGEKVLDSYSNAYGVYPLGWVNGQLVTVVIDAAGSSLRGLGEKLALSSNITRDWKLSPDGSELAYIEADASNGVRYVARTVALNGAARSQALALEATALGVAYAPGGEPRFGLEPGQASAAGLTTQELSTSAPGGFDVPLAYSKSGEALVVTHWTGSSFAQAGQPALQLLAGGQRTTYDSYTRFFGWSVR